MTGRLLLAPGPAADAAGLAARLDDAFLDATRAADGRAALAAARAEEPGLVLADAGAPGLSGLALCRALRADPRLAHLPVILLAARPGRAERLAGLEAGADDVAALDAPDDGLLARIRSLLHAKTRLDELRLREETSRELGLPADPGEAWARAADGPPADLLLLRPDAPERRRLAAQLAVELGAPPRAVPDGRAALAEVERRAPDLVLLDPGPDPESRRAALRLAAALRARPASRDSGVILAARDRAEGAAALDLGAADWLPAPLDLPELAARLRLQLRRKRYGDLLRGAVRDGLAMAATDALTGLSNRRCAETHLSRMLTRCAREGRPLSVMLLDLDRFKAINDAHGHPAGDAVLRGFAERLRGEVRAGDLVARLGGEEFCVAMPGAGAAEARGVAERVRAAVAAAPFPVPGGPAAPVTVSIGLAVGDPGAAPRAAAPLRPAASAAPPGLAEDAAPPPLRRRAAPAPLRAEGAAALIASADDALYRSKAAGRDRITLSAAGEATR